MDPFAHHGQILKYQPDDAQPAVYSISVDGIDQQCDECFEADGRSAYGGNDIGFSLNGGLTEDDDEDDKAKVQIKHPSRPAQ